MSTRRTQGILTILAIVALALAAYGSTIVWGGFVWDDDVLLTENQAVKSPDGLRRFWFTAEAFDYLPMTWTTLWLEWRLWGEDPTGYHITNVLMHALSAVLLWRLLRELRVPGAALAAAIFAVHPVCVASVAWISERKNTLSMIFYLLTLIAYARFDRQAGKRWYALAALAFLAALLSKASVIMAPVVVLGIAWWRRGRIARKDILPVLPLLAVSAVFAVVTIWFQQHHAVGTIPTRPEGFFSRLAAAGMVPWFYLYKILLPVNLTMVYPRWRVDPAWVVSYVPGVVLLGCLAVFWAYRRGWGRWPLAGMGYFVVTLFPVLGFFEMAYARKSLVADHLQYVSILGPLALLGALGAEAWRRLPGRAGKIVAAAVAAVVLACLTVLTFQRGFVFSNADAMWADVLEKNPSSPEAHYETGMRLTDEGKLDEALGHYIRAVALRPDYAEAHNNLGDVYIRLGNIPKAGYHFAASLAYLPDNHRARLNLALTQFRIGATRQAAGNLRQVIQGNPDYAPALNNLARILAADADDGLRDGAEAVTLARRACQLTPAADPLLPDRMNTLAMAYAETGQFDLAIQTAESAAELAATHGDAKQVADVQANIELYKRGQPVRMRIPKMWVRPASGPQTQPDTGATAE